MKLSRFLAIGVAAITTSVFVSPKVSAHNPVKYTNIPFVVGGLCTLGGYATVTSSVNYISQNGKLVLQINSPNQNSPGSGYAGWEVFSSFPGLNSGNTAPSATTSAPSGTYTFNLSGLSSSGNELVVTTLDALSNENQTIITVTNGPVSVVAPAAKDPGSPIVVVDFWIYNSSAMTSPYTVGNFTVNNQPLLIDTSHLDSSVGETMGSFLGAITSRLKPSQKIDLAQLPTVNVLKLDSVDRLRNLDQFLLFLPCAAFGL